MAERFNPYLVIFEPQKWCCDVLGEVLKDYDPVIHNFALGTFNGYLEMEKAGTDGATIATAGVGHMVDVRRIEDVLNNNLGIDLMLVNIEGYEYELIPHMLNHNILPKRLMIQFHEHMDATGLKFVEIRTLLQEKGYKLAWDYFPTLVAWER